MTERYDETRDLAEYAAFVADPDEDPVVVVAGCGTEKLSRSLERTA